ncbi:alpha/beta fold hydrolase [Paraglaciecola sp. 2405UD69-4]|uniref:alpha/beta fold hydrolase n=1 Tax=Paraglaciecola sp. 2405UD69-4 TaxID=3391836 RepID=UPI0039C9DA22
MSNVNYLIHSDDANKPWIILIHGLFGSLDNLSGLRRLFCEHFQVLSIDLPDHGKSGFTQAFSFKNYAQLISQTLTDLEIHKAIFVGHSLGGKIAMQIALDNSNLVERLVIIDIAPVEYRPRHNQVLAGLNAVDLANLESRKQAEQTLGEYIQEAGVRQFLLKSLYNQEDKWFWRFNLELLQRDYKKLSGAITADHSYDKPVLFIKGQLSDYLLAEHKNDTLKLFPKSQSKMITGVGHWLHAEKPKVCYEMIMSFALAQK